MMALRAMGLWPIHPELPPCVDVSGPAPPISISNKYFTVYKSSLLMFRILLSYLLLISCFTQAQPTPVVKANDQAAARWSPKKLDKMVFTTSVDPHWLKKSDRFWYMYETSGGKKWYIVDPEKAEKKLLFDNEKLAAA